MFYIIKSIRGSIIWSCDNHSSCSELSCAWICLLTSLSRTRRERGSSSRFETARFSGRAPTYSGGLKKEMSLLEKRRVSELNLLMFVCIRLSVHSLRSSFFPLCEPSFPFYRVHLLMNNRATALLVVH